LVRCKVEPRPRAEQAADAEAQKLGWKLAVTLSASKVATSEMAAPKGWTSAKTPWGDPDIGAVFTK
jgi:hypothetical protein